MKISGRQEGSINILMIPLILAVVLFFFALGFGLWAFSSRQDYKNNVDQKIADAVKVAQTQTATAKDSEFIEREKEPLKEYKGPSSYGSVSIKYPKTWSAYVDENGGSGALVDGYFHPSFVPGLQSNTGYALRFQVSDDTYAESLKDFDSDVKQGYTKAKPYKPVNVPNIVGLRLDGKLPDQKSGTLILIPLRDKTIKLWTESDQFSKDFEKNILANFKFSP
jgi:hypothetical protein